MPRRPEPSWCLFAATAVRDRLAPLAREAACARRGDDAECIHRMRVASRRLHVAFDLFKACLSAEDYRLWNKRIRRLRKALGATRDADVQIEFATGFLRCLREKAARPGVERLILRLRQKRAALQEDVRKAIARLQSSGVLGEIRKHLKVRLARAGRGRADPHAASVYDRAEAAVAARLRELLAFEPFVRRPGCIAEHHRMRIAAKRLRYTMEIFRELHPDKLKAPVRAARETQTRLGDLHDLDVWIAWLPQFLAEERDRTSDYFGDDRPFKPLEKGLLAMERHCRDARKARYAEFVTFWEGLRAEGVWERLREVLRQRPEPAGGAVEDDELPASAVTPADTGAAPFAEEPPA